jgi:S1-C subfamily serine protease
MESKLVACKCGTNLKIPESMATVKAVKCPKCGSVVDLRTTPQTTTPSENAPSRPAAKLASPPPSQQSALPNLLDENDAASAASDTKPCPYCGETIKAGAVKCKHCGEFLDAAKKPAAGKTRAIAGAAASSSDDPNPAEYFVAIVLAPIGLIIGLFWLIKKQGKAIRMLQASGLTTVIVLVTGLLLKMYVFSEDNSGPQGLRDGVQPQPYVVLVPDGQSEDGPPPSQRGRTPGSSNSHDLTGGTVDLKDQPPHIQRAMRANVRIEVQQGQGSGVVVQRNDDAVVILTNRHVIDPTFGSRPATPDLKTVPRPRITYFTEQSNPGLVIWIAPDEIDLALVQASAPKDIEPVHWSETPKVLAGQEVFAVGNPIGLNWSFSKGVVSAVRQRKHGNREVGVIQTDTKITYGNSGGGLYTSDGVLIGINTFIADPRLGGGIGFALRPQVLIELKPAGLLLPKPGA